MYVYICKYIYILNLYISKINIDKQCNSWAFEQNLLSTELQLLALASAAGCEVAKGTPGLARRDAQIHGKTTGKW